MHRLTRALKKCLVPQGQAWQYNSTSEWLRLLSAWLITYENGDACVALIKTVSQRAQVFALGPHMAKTEQELEEAVLPASITGRRGPFSLAEARTLPPTQGPASESPSHTIILAYFQINPFHRLYTLTQRN